MTPFNVRYYSAFILKDINAKPSNIKPIFTEFDLKLVDIQKYYN